jgi:hypothetical protein
LKEGFLKANALNGRGVAYGDWAACYLPKKAEAKILVEMTNCFAWLFSRKAFKVTSQKGSLRGRGALSTFKGGPLKKFYFAAGVAPTAGEAAGAALGTEAETFAQGGTGNWFRPP